jgi:hypothetical protein
MEGQSSGEIIALQLVKNIIGGIVKAINGNDAARSNGKFGGKYPFCLRNIKPVVVDTAMFQNSDDGLVLHDFCFLSTD